MEEIEHGRGVLGSELNVSSNDVGRGANLMWSIKALLANDGGGAGGMESKQFGPVLMVAT
jgi:hypothetical protein